MPFVKVDRKFYNLIWFLFIVHHYNSIFFYRVSINLFKIIGEIDNPKIFHKIFYFGLASTNNYFNFLKGKFYLLYSSEFTILSNFASEAKSFLFAINYCGYFVNPFYFSQIADLNSFYSNNYLFIIFYTSSFFIKYNKFLMYTFRVLSFRILSLVLYIIGLYKSLPHLLLKKQNIQIQYL